MAFWSNYGQYKLLDSNIHNLKNRLCGCHIANFIVFLQTLFKLHSPNNYIVGGGFFVRHSILPISLAWDAFGIKNGADTYDGFRQKVMNYNKSGEVNPSIGCTILTEPFFLTSAMGHPDL